jgi:antitoxin component YwqK of YwqJK toxin-antitoxin module
MPPIKVWNVYWFMQLKEKNNSMKSCLIIAAVSLIGFTACRTEVKAEHEMTEREKQVRDSVSKIEQRKVVDSLKKKNPLLIMPPDSTYTGDYIDKYENGITKFRGFFRFGKRHGQWMSFYPNGGLWSEMHYDKGLREGPNVTYYEDGKTKRYEGFYKNDTRDSIWCYYDSVGNVAERIMFRNDKVVKKLPLK